MKSKKGFTLIELLAIIVILAIIAVITVPIILGIIDNSKKGAARDSAYGYKDAVNRWYLEKLSVDHNYMLNGTYRVRNGNLEGQEIALSGEKPSKGLLTYENNVLISGCLQFGEYSITFVNGQVDTTEKEKCNTLVYEDVDSSETLTRYDIVSLGSEQFYVLEPENSNGNITLLARTCLKNDSGTWRQKVGDESCDGVSFMNNSTRYGYWRNKVGDGLEYPGQYCTSSSQTGCAYVYDSGIGVGRSVTSYAATLSVSADGRLLSLEEAKGLNNSIPYWIGSAYSESYAWIVSAGGSFNHPSTTFNLYSIRPVIEIPMSEL